MKTYITAVSSLDRNEIHLSKTESRYKIEAMRHGFVSHPDVGTDGYIWLEDCTSEEDVIDTLREMDYIIETQELSELS